MANRGTNESATCFGLEQKSTLCTEINGTLKQKWMQQAGHDWKVSHNNEASLMPFKTVSDLRLSIISEASSKHHFF